MLTLVGQVVNVFETPKGTTKEGKEYGGGHKVQLMSETYLKNGEKRAELVDLTVDDPRPFRELLGKRVTMPVGVMSRGSSTIFFHVRTAPNPVAAA